MPSATRHRANEAHGKQAHIVWEGKWPRAHFSSTRSGLSSTLGTSLPTTTEGETETVGDDAREAEYWRQEAETLRHELDRFRQDTGEALPEYL